MLNKLLRASVLLISKAQSISCPESDSCGTRGIGFALSESASVITQGVRGPGAEAKFFWGWRTK